MSWTLGEGTLSSLRLGRLAFRVKGLLLLALRCLSGLRRHQQTSYRSIPEVCRSGGFKARIPS